MRCCVIGAGSGGRAFAAYLSSKGHEVTMYNRSYYRICDIRKTREIKVEGELEGTFPIKYATQNLWYAVKDVDFIFIVTPASAHRTIAKQLALLLKEGQFIILNPGRTFGAIEFAKIVEEKRGDFPCFIAETQTLLFTCRADTSNGVSILKIKDSVNFSTYPDKYVDFFYEMMKDTFPQLIPIDNYLEVTLNNIGMLVHPAISLLNAGMMDSGCSFKFYSEGASPRTCMVLEKIESEINQIFKRLGIKQFRFHKWAKRSYGVKAKSVHEAIQKIEPYKTIDAPKELVTRYFTEDVPTGLVPIASLADYLDINTPTINSIIHLASILCGKEFYKEGRTIEKLNIEYFIDQSVVAEEVQFEKYIHINSIFKNQRDEEI